MNDIYNIYRKIRTDCTTHLEVQDKMIKDYGYTWQEITEAKVAMEANEPNYWIDKATPQEWAAIRPDMVNSPPHYLTGGIETIDYIKAKLTAEEFKGYLRGNVLKYASRKKGGDDMGKAAWYAKRLEGL
jgi:hypothetical protein